MKSLFYIIFFTLIFNCCTAQQNEYPFHKQAILNRMIDYQSSIELSDSLYRDFNKIDTITKNNVKELEELYFILNSYITAKQFTNDTTYVNNQINIVTEKVNLNNIAWENEMYQRMINKAEEYYKNGNIIKSIELYNRAINYGAYVLIPSDEKVLKRLEEIKHSLQ